MKYGDYSYSDEMSQVHSFPLEEQGFAFQELDGELWLVLLLSPSSLKVNASDAIDSYLLDAGIIIGQLVAHGGNKQKSKEPHSPESEEEEEEEEKIRLEQSEYKWSKEPYGVQVRLKLGKHAPDTVRAVWLKPRYICGQIRINLRRPQPVETQEQEEYWL